MATELNPGVLFQVIYKGSFMGAIPEKTILDVYGIVSNQHGDAYFCVYNERHNFFMEVKINQCMRMEPHQSQPK